MRVDNNSLNNVQSGETTESGRSRRTTRTDKSGETGRTDNAGGADAASTQISGRAKEFAAAKQVAAEAPDVREAKIQELRERIARKEYNVKPEDVADRMIKEHMQSNGIG
jgi:negative regulator of flagellin synthesis FlgM